MIEICHIETARLERVTPRPLQQRRRWTASQSPIHQRITTLMNTPTLVRYKCSLQRGEVLRAVLVHTQSRQFRTSSQGFHISRTGILAMDDLPLQHLVVFLQWNLQYRVSSLSFLVKTPIMIADVDHVIPNIPTHDIWLNSKIVCSSKIRIFLFAILIRCIIRRGTFFLRINSFETTYITSRTWTSTFILWRNMAGLAACVVVIANVMWPLGYTLSC